jgi:hypothetical protein
MKMKRDGTFEVYSEGTWLIFESILLTVLNFYPTVTVQMYMQDNFMSLLGQSQTFTVNAIRFFCQLTLKVQPCLNARFIKATGLSIRLNRYLRAHTQGYHHACWLNPLITIFYAGQSQIQNFMDKHSLPWVSDLVSSPWSTYAFPKYVVILSYQPVTCLYFEWDKSRYLVVLRQAATSNWPCLLQLQQNNIVPL